MIIVKPHGNPPPDITNCRQPILLAVITVIAPVFDEHGVDCVITSAAEVYKHKAERSAHYRGDALDIRSKHLQTVKVKEVVLQKLRDRLGPNFVVILESIGKPYEHYHIHWSPTFSEEHPTMDMPL